MAQDIKKELYNKLPKNLINALDEILSEDEEIKESGSIYLDEEKINEEFPEPIMFDVPSEIITLNRDLDYFDDEDSNNTTEDVEDEEGDDVDDLQEEEDNVCFFNDKDEDFRCELSVEGVNISKCKVRLNLETKEWNLYFNGKIDKKGNCEINVTKLSILSEGTKGKAILEILADDTVFIPWESEFTIKKSKKVTVKIADNSGKKDSKIKLKRIG